MLLIVNPGFLRNLEILEMHWKFCKYSQRNFPSDRMFLLLYMWLLLVANNCVIEFLCSRNPGKLDDYDLGT